MSFNNTKTPTIAEVNPEGKAAEYQVKKYLNKRHGMMEYQLRGNIRKKFIELFPIRSNRELIELFGIGFSSIQRFKHELGLQKDMEVIKHHQAQQIKILCENNGYYDSMRGKQPSEQCKQAFQEYVYSNRYKHPMHTIKEIDPKRYARLIKNRSKERQELERKERRRVNLGLSQQTDLHRPLIKFSRQQLCYRHNMKKRGYILGSMYEEHGERYVIYYDSKTMRSNRAESNASTFQMEIKPLPDDDNTPTRFKPYNNSESLNSLLL